MARKSKVLASFADAVADIADGSTIGFGGFAAPGVPLNLMRALALTPARDLICVANVTGRSASLDEPSINTLVARGMVRKAICAFTAATRASDDLPFTRHYEAGDVEAELVPQGTLAERLRAAGAGIPAFYTPTAVGTELADGRETRNFAGRDYLLEHALPLDYAFIRAHRADAFGNLRFRRSQRNFNPVMAMAARIVIAEIETEIEPTGAFDPDDIHLSGIFVHRLVVIPPAPEGLWPQIREPRT